MSGIAAQFVAAFCLVVVAGCSNAITTYTRVPCPFATPPSIAQAILLTAAQHGLPAVRILARQTTAPTLLSPNLCPGDEAAVALRSLELPFANGSFVDDHRAAVACAYALGVLDAFDALRRAHNDAMARANIDIIQVRIAQVLLRHEAMFLSMTTRPGGAGLSSGAGGGVKTFRTITWFFFDRPVNVQSDPVQLGQEAIGSIVGNLTAALLIDDPADAPMPHASLTRAFGGRPDSIALTLGGIVGAMQTQMHSDVAYGNVPGIAAVAQTRALGAGFALSDDADLHAVDPPQRFPAFHDRIVNAVRHSVPRSSRLVADIARGYSLGLAR